MFMLNKPPDILKYRLPVRAIACQTDETGIIAKDRGVQRAV
jgi:hypothetical protein